ncbi:alanyl-tRNA editing protein [Undibacterium terreum]|uniref:Alanyl-tRNA editing protein n=1 Tax=Undibacterium terreum TaxID=1224302 RepID=A0A916UB05_9BURK|nr:alanyl-tRNA editing protein [Undibacterium terreum]GGC65941.1 alanyl-tRNA editing protein [Undibacterium terreum]
MTKKIFWNDPYLTSLDTMVSRVDGERVWLRETILFAFSGGQESDAGTVNGHAVLSAEKQGQEISYLLAPGHGLQTDEHVRLELDWGRRYALMRLHFAAEMILQMMYKLRPGIERLGAHIAADKARIDFASAENLSPLFAVMEKDAALLVAKDLPIITAFSDEATERRYWAVEDFARMPCGGTHPRSTGEIGRIALKRKNTGKGKERIEISLLESGSITAPGLAGV